MFQSWHIQLPGLLRYLIGRSIWMAVLRFVSVGLGFAVTTVLVRRLGAADFGVFALAISIATILALPLTGGLPVLLTREIAKALHRGEGGRVKGVVRWAVSVLGGVALVLGGIGTALWVGLQASEVWVPRAGLGRMAVLVAMLILAMGIMHVLRGIVLGHGRPVQAGLGEQFLRPALMLGLLLAVPQFLGGGADALAYQVAATALAALAVCFLAWATLQRPEAEPPVFDSRAWAWALAPLTAIATTTIVKNNTDIIMLGAMRPVEDVGVYRIAAQIAVVAAIPKEILRSVLMPRLAAFHGAGNRIGMGGALALSARLSFLVTLVIFVGFVLFGRSFLAWVFGPEHVASYLPCLILAGGLLVSSGTGLVVASLQMSDNAGYVARAAVMSALLNVVLNLALVPAYGTVGAAIGTSVALVVMQVQLWQHARSVLGLRTDAFQLRRGVA